MAGRVGARGRLSLAGLALACLPMVRLAWGLELVQLKDTHATGDTQRVKVVMEARGQIQAEDGKTTFPMSATAQAVYQERWYAPDSQRTVVRQYEKAVARLKVGDSADEITLPQEKKTVVIQLSDGASPTWSAQDAHFSRRELDAIRIPGNSLLLSGLLPKDAVGVGDTWVPDGDTLAGILQLDEVTGPEVRCKLIDVDRGLAKVQFSGQLVGRVDGATSGIELSGELRCDVGAQRIRWLQLKLREDRDAGPVTPAFKVAAEIRMLLESAPPAGQPSFPATAPAVAEHDRWLEFESPEGGFRFLHEPNWSIVDDRGQRTILRWLDGGRVLVQCHISRLPKLASGKQLGLEALQADVKKSFGEKFGEFEFARQDTRRDGVQVLRVVANGEVDGGRVLWVFCHLASAAGDRASMIFTMDAATAKKYHQIDKLLVESLRFIPVRSATPPAEEARPAPEQARRAPVADAPRR